MTILYWGLQWTWGILQNICGLALFLLNRKGEHFFYHGALVTVWKIRRCSCGCGMFIFMSPDCAGEKNTPLARDEAFRRVLVHEFGHTVQSMILGPLFLIVAVLSPAWAFLPFFSAFRKKKGISYYAFITESTANYLGEKFTKEMSVGRKG